VNRRYGFAHRGGSAHGPDNVLSTFVEALRRGATGLETDAWVTADGSVVLDHDGVLRAARLRRQPIAEVRRDQLPAHVPTLDELFTACGTDFDLAVDVSTTRIASAVSRIAVAAGAADRLWLVAPHSAVLREVGPARRAVTVRGPVMRSPSRAAALRGIRAAGMDAVNARWPWWTPRFVAETHGLGLLAFGYDAQRQGSLRRCVTIGLDGVFSDHVDRLVAALGQRAGGDSSAGSSSAGAGR
jgi:glycerophosphoryl diester phosphodiesterase